MSLLVLPLARRTRLRARRDAGNAEVAPAPPEFDYLLSADGRTVTHSGRAAAAQLPRAERLVLVAADDDVAWHRIDIPKAPAARLRAALAGAMEDELLDDAQALHYALGPGAASGSAGWVAVMHRGWLADTLATLEAAGREVDLVAPASWPRAATSGHFRLHDGNAPPVLVVEGPQGVACVGLEGTLARSLLPADAHGVRCTATAAAAAAAERWLDAAVTVLGDAERALAAASSPVDLRQFDLAARHRGLRALREGWRRLQQAQWRAARTGLVALVAVQVAGLNAYAWQQQHALDARRQAMDELLRSTFPGVRTVLDAPLQMQRESERARAQAGRAGDGDLETLLGAAAAAWPDGAQPAASVRFDHGRLVLAAPGWSAAQERQFRERLLGSGVRGEVDAGRVSVTATGAGA